MRILVVEDERKLAQALASALKAERYEVVLAPTGEDGFFRANAESFDLVLLDLMLPGRNGLEILQTLRKRQVQTPVLILTARDGVEDRVLGLDLGADDYLVKPFALPEILARVRALLRRGRPTDVARLNVEAASEVTVIADRLMLRAAVTNVLDNAIKYGPDSSTVTISVNHVGDEGVLAIADHGPGIPAEHRERIFHRFFRIDKARSRDRGGAGLGLSIAKWAVEINGGRIAVREARGGGSEFLIHLPVGGSSAERREREA